MRVSAAQGWCFIQEYSINVWIFTTVMEYEFRWISEPPGSKNGRRDAERSGTCQRGNEGPRRRFPSPPIHLRFFLISVQNVPHVDYPPEVKIKKPGTKYSFLIEKN